MEKSFCTECGAQVAADDMFCENCGAKLAGPALAAPTPVESPRKAPNILWGLLTIVLATILLVAILLGIRRLREPREIPDEPPASVAPVQSEPSGSGLIPPGAQETEPGPEARPLPPPPPGAGFQSFGDMSEEEFMEYSKGLWERSQREKQ